MSEREIIELIRGHYHEYGLEDIRQSLLEEGYPAEYANALISRALYSKVRPSRLLRNLSITALSAFCILAAIAGAATLIKNDQEGPNPADITMPQLQAPTLQQALEAFLNGDQKAPEMLKPLAESGNAQAQTLLGNMYNNSVPSDPVQAAQWYQRAAQQDNTEAQEALGKMYLQGRGVQQDYEEAAKWLRLAARKNSVEAQVELASLHEQGVIAGSSFIQAAYWYEKAAQAGHLRAQGALGILYSKGQGVKQDFSQAAHWCLKAAEQGHIPCQAVLGVLYSTGQGVKKDLKEAYKWSYLASSAGNPAAALELERLKKQGVTP